MVALSPRFTLIASMSVIAALSLGPSPGNAAAIQARHRSEENSRTHGSEHLKPSSSKMHSESSDTQGPDTVPKVLSPTIPLPAGATSRKNKVGKTENSSKKAKQHQSKDKRTTFYDPFNPLLQMGNVWMGDQPPSKRAETVVNGDNEHVHIHDRHHEHDRVVINGHNDRVHVHRSPIPQPHHHHHHQYDHHGKVIVNGDDDHVSIHERRHHHHQYDHHGKVVVNGDHDDVNVHRRNAVEQFEGVPGSIDIMSDVAGSDVGQKIASLILSHANGTNPGDPFILDASSTNSTQVYLVALASEAANSTTTTESMNGTSVSGNSDTTTADNSTMPDPYRKVTITLPMFDPEDASMKTFCATYDDKPSSPAPMTVEPCTNSAESVEHRSQVFAYEPDTGVIRPMWFDDLNSNGADEGTDSDLGDDEAGPPLVPQDGTNNSTSAATPDSSSPSNSSETNATDFNGRMLDAEFGDATRPPAAAAKSLAAGDPYSMARNVTLVFTPDPSVMVASESGLVDKDSRSSNSSSIASSVSPTSTLSSTSVATSTTISSSDAVATETLSASASVMKAISTSASSTTSTSNSASLTGSSMPTDTVVVSSTQDESIAQPTAGALDVEVVNRNPNTVSEVSETSIAASTATSESASTTFSASGSSFTGFGAFAASTTVDASTSSVTATSTPCASFSTMSESANIQDISSSMILSSGTGTSAAPSMTPVSTAPYEWMFKEGIVHHV